MQPEKKQLETILLHYFRECYPDFPKGKLIPSESPDFILTLKSRNNLGIELTRLNPVNAQVPDYIQIAKIAFREHLIGFVKNLFEKHSQLTLFVKFLFSNTKTISPEKEMMAAVKIVHAIRKLISNWNPDGFFYGSIGQSELPEGLDGLFIIHHPGLKTSIWERANNLGISENVLEDIRLSIVKKDEKLWHYQKQRLNYYWLIVLTDRLRGVKSYNLPVKIVNQNFQSRFQHVFLFDITQAEIFQLV